MARLRKLGYDLSPQHKTLSEHEWKEQLLSFNTEVAEIFDRLPDETQEFGWFLGCKTIEWHAMAYIITEICCRDTRLLWIEPGCSGRFVREGSRQ